MSLVLNFYLLKDLGAFFYYYFYLKMKVETLHKDLCGINIRKLSLQKGSFMQKNVHFNSWKRYIVIINPIQGGVQKGPLPVFPL